MILLWATGVRDPKEPSMYLTAREVQPGDRIVRPDTGETIDVRHVMTTGKKAKTTTISKTNDPAPLHTAPDALVEVLR